MPGNHIVNGVVLARELVNEPPNVLFPAEFARRAGELKKLGVTVEVLDVKAMTKLAWARCSACPRDLCVPAVWW